MADGGIEIPAEVIQKYMDAADTTDDPETPEPAAESDEPETEAQDTSEEEPEAEDAETEDEEAGGDEPEEEQEEEAEEADDEAADSEDADFLPPFDRKAVEKDPNLKAAYKHMRAAFTRAQQQSRQAQREAALLKQSFEEFRDSLATDEGATDLLLNVALNRPQLFEDVYQKAAKLVNDEDERKVHEREQRVKQKEREQADRERREAAVYAERRTTEITEATHYLAGQLGLDESTYPVVEQFVANKILENRARTGRPDASDEDVRVAVKAAARYLKAQREAYRQQLDAERRVEAKKDVKKAAKAAKRPPPPKASTAPASKKGVRPPVPQGRDPTDFAVDLALGLVE